MSAPENLEKALQGLKSSPLGARNSATLTGSARNPAILKLTTRYSNWQRVIQTILISEANWIKS